MPSVCVQSLLCMAMHSCLPTFDRSGPSTTLCQPMTHHFSRSSTQRRTIKAVQSAPIQSIPESLGRKGSDRFNWVSGTMSGAVAIDVAIVCVGGGRVHDPSGAVLRDERMTESVLLE